MSCDNQTARCSAYTYPGMIPVVFNNNSYAALWIYTWTKSAIMRNNLFLFYFIFSFQALQDTRFGWVGHLYCGSLTRVHIKFLHPDLTGLAEVGKISVGWFFVNHWWVFPKTLRPRGEFASGMPFLMRSGFCSVMFLFTINPTGSFLPLRIQHPRPTYHWKFAALVYGFSSSHLRIGVKGWASTQEIPGWNLTPAMNSIGNLKQASFFQPQCLHGCNMRQ